VLVQLTEVHAARPIVARKGDTVEVRLPETPASGYQWRWRVPEGLCMLTDEHLPAEAEGSPASDAGHRRLAFGVSAPGQHELRAELARPWESEPRQALTFTVHAQ
jgi:inhibitor of cysteine peptidase